MKLKTRYIIYLALLSVIAWVVYLAREVLTPFLFAAIASYLLNPVVTFLTARLRLSRSLAITLVTLIIVLVLGLVLYVLGSKLISESRDFASDASLILHEVEQGQNSLPPEIKPLVTNLTESARNSLNISSQQVFRLFSGAINSILFILVFFLGLIYFLKEGGNMVEATQNLMPSNWKIEFAIISRRINQVLGNYLRAQFLLMLVMSVSVGLSLFILGAKYTLLLALAVGLAEVMPYVGPTIAFVSVFAVITLTGGVSRLALPPVYEAAIAIAIYFVLNQIQNYIISPQVTGRLVKLHPLLIITSVLVGGHLFGFLGIVLAVPIVASFKVTLEHILGLLD